MKQLLSSDFIYILLLSENMRHLNVESVISLSQKKLELYDLFETSKRKVKSITAQPSCFCDPYN